MVIIRLWGGVGNQLFQYAFGLYLQNKYKSEQIVFDISSFGNSDKARKLELIEIVPNLPITTDISFARYVGIKNRVYRFFYSLRNVFIEESNYSDSLLSKMLSKKKEIYLQGYWQNEQYAKFLLEKKITMPQIPNCIKKSFELIGLSDCSIALHVRRGDYFLPKNIKEFGVCDELYYEKSLRYLFSYLNNINVCVFLFSDDVEWVQSHLSLPNKTHIVYNHDIPQFWYIYLMSLCHHNIISNSTFSWWGAYLNANVSKLIISPKCWTKTSDKTLSLNDWIKF